MLIITLTENENYLSFESNGHLENKELCGVITLAIKGVYAVIAQNKDNIISQIAIGNGIIKFELRKSLEVINYINILLAMLYYLQSINPNSINICIK